MCLLPFDGPSLVSAGGDTDLYVWNWPSGTLRTKIPIFEHIKPFMVVSGNKMRKEAKELAFANFQQRSVARKKKKKGSKQKAEDDSASIDDATPEPDAGAVDMEILDEEGPQPIQDASALATVNMDILDEEEPLVVSKISFFTTFSGNSVLMWSVVGCVHHKVLGVLRSDLPSFCSALHHFSISQVLTSQSIPLQ